MSRPAFIEVDGRRTRIRVDGDPDNPPVLLVHGIGRSMEDWAPQYEQLARSYRTIAVDVPGFGFSERTREAITLPALARGVTETLDTLGETRPVHVVGNSLGGAIAQRLLADQPERVASLALINSAGFGSEVTLLLRMLTMPVLGPMSTRKPNRMSAVLFERAIHADKAVATKERIDHAHAVGSQPGAGAVMREAALALGTPRGVKPQWRRELAAAVARTPRPTLIMWGTQDRILPAHHIDEAMRVYPHAEVHLLNGVGHMPQIECPKRFADLLLPFLVRATA
ncbi:pimeloyl-ACP methyl ester carboxylesterase [Mycolicibacterium sp. BK556]|uniref:alpha/beta fold hydrolase n=1 Tax=Mycobacteriaceae TaxID=1762 RepID=UPI001060F648|nr:MULTISPECIES: alpha/beta fold hydrolase [Mycobacteriaceae]MBB3606178.1 pimeloyl-ACP methyl ester carboxylesterase [Mycolicibacterium sp. BK556]MBB3632756.1 pimeloyl-ACP methyl ester carboxylesterase [Mycolicibacterium sp. BK607]MBB3754105.1 pimeloyl-ACP methyl ester carboxylesterase [Mycolicibacterium sp. BK634]TDO17921.1 pimeloyl-ACP methyl ester carboxylesterase [Mycobacterium sp. BK086]